MTRVIGVGQPFAADDGVGLEVARRVRALCPADARGGAIDVVEVADPSAIPALLDGVRRAVIVDAAIGAGAPGTVRVLDAEALRGGAIVPLSSHAIGVADAIAIARAVYAGAADDVRVVCVAIDPPRPARVGLSPAVAAAIDEAARVVLCEAGLDA